MNGVLVDTSAWIDFFRGNAAAVRRVDPLLASGDVAVMGAVFAEVVSGAQNRQNFDRLSVLLRSLDWIEPPASAWDRIAETRFTLARQGTQVHLVDLLIAATALHSGHTLLTRDRDFRAIARVLPVDVELF